MNADKAQLQEAYRLNEWAKHYRKELTENPNSLVRFLTEKQLRETEEKLQQLLIVTKGQMEHDPDFQIRTYTEEEIAHIARQVPGFSDTFEARSEKKGGLLRRLFKKS